MQALFLFSIMKADISHEGVGRESKDSENIFGVNIAHPEIDTMLHQ